MTNHNVASHNDVLTAKIRQSGQHRSVIAGHDVDRFVALVEYSQRSACFRASDRAISMARAFGPVIQITAQIQKLALQSHGIVRAR
jgi:hypothetical protein